MAKKTTRNITTSRGRNSGDVKKELQPSCCVCGSITPPRQMMKDMCPECFSYLKTLTR